MFWWGVLGVENGVTPRSVHKLDPVRVFGFGSLLDTSSTLLGDFLGLPQAPQTLV